MNTKKIEHSYSYLAKMAQLTYVTCVHTYIKDANIIIVLNVCKYSSVYIMKSM